MPNLVGLTLEQALARADEVGFVLIVAEQVPEAASVVERSRFDISFEHITTADVRGSAASLSEVGQGVLHVRQKSGISALAEGIPEDELVAVAAALLPMPGETAEATANGFRGLQQTTFSTVSAIP